MNKNVGIIDRIVRITIGPVLIAYAIPLGLPQTGWNWVGWVGFVPLVTGLFGMCPAYKLLRVSTSSAKPSCCG